MDRVLEVNFPGITLGSVPDSSTIQLKLDLDYVAYLNGSSGELIGVLKYMNIPAFPV